MEAAFTDKGKQNALNDKSPYPAIVWIAILLCSLKKSFVPSNMPWVWPSGLHLFLFTQNHALLVQGMEVLT